jgi:hypothetical protein
MKYVIKNLVVEVLPKNIKGKGEGKSLKAMPAGSPSPCWCTPEHPTCWCTCGGCSSLTHGGVVAGKREQLSKLKNLEKELLAGVKELRRRQKVVGRVKAK